MSTIDRQYPTTSNTISLLKSTKGFTFIELIIVLSIVSVIAGVVSFRFSDFSNNISLQTLSQDIALLIKEAQTNAISGKLVQGFGGDETPIYGVFFDKNKNNSFALFRDLSPQNYVMDGNCNNAGKPGYECLSLTTITSGDKISDLCDNTGVCGYKRLDIAFERPYPDPKASGKKGTSTVLLPGGAQIEIISKNAQYKHIIIWPTGQISVRSGRAEDLDGCGAVGDPCQLDNPDE